MAVNKSIKTKIQEYHNQGYMPDEILRGIENSENYPEIAEKIKQYRKEGYEPKDILNGLNQSEEIDDEDKEQEKYTIDPQEILFDRERIRLNEQPAYIGRAERAAISKFILPDIQEQIENNDPLGIRGD